MQSINFQSFNTQRPNPKMDPDSYAKNYATQNNLSLEEAKETLSTKYGTPQQPSIFESQAIQNTIGSYDPSEFEKIGQDASFKDLFKDLFTDFMGIFKGQSKEDNEDTTQFMGQDPDTFAQIYADKHDITLEEAKEELKALYGEPKQQ